MRRPLLRRKTSLTGGFVLETIYSQPERFVQTYDAKYNTNPDSKAWHDWPHFAGDGAVQAVDVYFRILCRVDDVLYVARHRCLVCDPGGHDRLRHLPQQWPHEALPLSLRDRTEAGVSPGSPIWGDDLGGCMRREDRGEPHHG